jgi:hypothetical protein
MTYAGGAKTACFEFAKDTAGAHLINFIQGVAFACEAHSRAGHIPLQTDAAAKATTGVNAHVLAQLVRQARGRLPVLEGDPPRYEFWRRAVAAGVADLTGLKR